MKNVSSKKGYMTRMNHPHVDPPRIILIQEIHNGKSGKYFVKLKLHIYPMEYTSDLYEFKMSLFDNGDPEEFLLFVRNFNITLSASGALEVGTKGQYLCTLVHGEALLHFDSFSADVESTQTLNVDDIIKGLVQYFPPVNSLSEQKRSMRHGVKKPRALTVRRYTARLIDLNEYLASFPEATLNDKIGVTEQKKSS